MRKSWLMILIIILVVILDFGLRTPNRCVSIAAEPHAQQEHKARIPITGLQVIFNCDKVKASMTDTVVFDVAILNVDEHPADLFQRLEWGEGGGLLLWFRDGKKERFRPWVDPPYPPPPPDDPGLFIKVEPGRFYGVRERWPVKSIGRGRPGKYTIWVDYTSPVFRENVYDAKFNRNQMPYWFDFQGVNSNEVAFESIP
jgi:hypothetical protein